MDRILPRFIFFSFSLYLAVNKEILDELNKTEIALQESNENPYTFEWMIRNNMMDCGSFLSPYDQKW